MSVRRRRLVMSGGNIVVVRSLTVCIRTETRANEVHQLGLGTDPNPQSHPLLISFFAQMQMPTITTYPDLVLVVRWECFNKDQQTRVNDSYLAWHGDMRHLHV